MGFTYDTTIPRDRSLIINHLKDVMQFENKINSEPPRKNQKRLRKENQRVPGKNVRKNPIYTMPSDDQWAIHQNLYEIPWSF